MEKWWATLNAVMAILFHEMGAICGITDTLELLKEDSAASTVITNM